MQFTKPICKTICDDIEEAVQQVATKHGVHIRRGHARFTSANITLKLEVSTLADDGTVMSRERGDFLAAAVFYGLSPTDIDKTIRYAGDRFTIIGLREKSRKYPIIVRSESNGKIYKLPADGVKAALVRSVE